MNHPQALPVKAALLLLALLCLSTALGGDLPKTEKEPQSRPLTEKELTTLLDGLETRLGKIRSFRADFVQEKHLSIFTEVVRVDGVLLFWRPGKVRFEITQPFQSVFIAAGKSAAKYERMEGSWKKLKPRAPAMRIVLKEITSWLEGRLRQEGGRYDISAARAKFTTITLTVRNKKMRDYITAIELTLDKEETHFSCVTIREPGGDFTRILFVDSRHNVEMPAEIFATDGPEPAPLSLLPPLKPKREPKAGQGGEDSQGEEPP